MRKFSFMLVVLWLVSIAIASAQIRSVSGKITDASGAAIPFASVKISGSRAGVSADDNGTFVIKAQSGDKLVISAVGYTAQTVTIPAGQLFITLTKEQNTLSEVVVTTALGIKRQPKELGYSTATVGNAELTQARVTNLANGLSSKVSGVEIRLADNSVNPNVKITFRGNRSLTGNNTALIIVDGIPVEQSYIASLNPDDVENVSILKSANAAALYGKDASNGVMIINTKKGARSKLAVTYRNTTMWNKVSYMPALQTEYGPYGGEGGGFNDPVTGCVGCVTYVDPFTGKPLATPFENQNFGPAYNDLDFPLAQIAIGGPDPNGKIIYGPYKAIKDNRKDFFQTGLNEQNNLSVSTGTTWGSLFASGQNVVNKGVVYNDKYTRTSGRIGGRLNFGRFSADGSFNYSHQVTDQTGLNFSGGTQYRPVYWSVINQPPHINLKDFKDVDHNFFASPSGYINAYYTNPWYQVFHSRAKNTNNALTSYLQLNYKLLSWLSFSARGGYSKTTIDAPAHIDAYAFAPIAQTDPWSAGNTASSYANLPYQSELIKIKYDDLNTDGFFTIKKGSGSFDFTGIVGANYRSRNSHGYWYSNQAVATMSIPNSYTKRTNADGSAYQDLDYKARSQAVYADLTIGYDKWLFLHGSFRNDWLSILEPTKRSFRYGGVDLSAVLSDKLDFLKNSNTISFLKIRAGYAITGNVSFPNTTSIGFLNNSGANGNNGLAMPTFSAYYLYPTTTVGVGFPYGNLPGYSLGTRVVQTGIKPEKDGAAEVGFEIGFLHDRIRFEASGFSTTAKNQTLPLLTSNASGVATYVVNAGKVLDRGYELELHLTPLLKFGAFKWNFNANFTQLDDKVKEIDPSRGLNNVGLQDIKYGTNTVGSIRAIAGNSYPTLMVTDWNRDDQGRIIVNKSTGMPSANTTQKAVGNTNYRYMLGLNSNFSFKGLTLNAVFDYRGGAKGIAALGNALDFAGISENSATNREHFIIPNSAYLDNGKYVPNTTVPTSGQVASFWANVYNGIGAPYVFNASFWKLRELSLGYDLPVKRMGFDKVVKRLNFAVVGQNLFMWRPKNNPYTDPEFSDSGSGNAIGSTSEYQLPPLRSFGFTLSATF
ncbi:SusC/RagA family TonB-linked outer membrane protein [Deminuibacter soli]|uniref:SusC/RagA family TonB-linked outer membrane protein n=1 Tax=Deminuibacter soli TaxID=2291815 RepID=A0A3E1NDY7_9BACT|nr:SusC/RagA family TonB-linked outer membrane protein [Deminuibacter soli]RFM25988.1 SusC/RagA family TonB-linked outer membrane protein [Deminuibacter soli]